MSQKNGTFGGTIRFKEVMNELIKNLSSLSGLAIEMIQNGQKALLSDDEGLLKQLEIELNKVHEITSTIENIALSSIALHQPFASDLRFIISTLKISNDIHRSAHDAVHVARSTTYIDLANHPLIIQKIGILADKATSMFKLSIETFKKRKEINVKNWIALDDEVDSLHREIIEEVVVAMENDPKWCRAGVSLILSTRYIERIGDHACNIAEESNYVATSKRVKIE
ncbi:MAG: phosphate signaling complex protein PhoU [Candidatus Thorarchaeota archaeon]